MQKGLRIAIFIIAGLIGLVAAGFLAAETARAGLWDPTPEPDIPTEEEIPTALLIEKAEQLEEVKAYKERYPNPSVISERMYGLDVTYTMLRCEVTGEPCVKVKEIDPYAGLQVWFNEDLSVKGFVLWCVDGVRNGHLAKITSNIVEYLEAGKCV